MGNQYTANSDPTQMCSRLDHFLMMMPGAAIQNIVSLTNIRLNEKKKTPIDYDELLSFFGVIILGTRFESSGRASLWNKTSTSRFVPPPDFGRTGLSRRRFEDIWYSLRFSYQPDTRPLHMSSEDYRWMLVDDFFSFINVEREKFFDPSSELCVDESMVRWYGIGRDWINEGLPMYVDIDRKPEAGCEIQNVCDGKSDNGTLSDPDLISFAWVDRNCPYFVSTVSNLRKAAPISRTRLRQVDQEPNAAPEPVHLSIRQPQASKIYYDNCGRIDQHNRIRQADLKVERKYGTNDWSLRVNLSLFSICVVDSYLLWNGTTGVKESLHDFFSALAEELIDYGHVTRAQLKAIDDIATPALKRTHNSVAAGVGPHITPLKISRVRVMRLLSRAV
eukprot:scaffold16003_cov149-Amphora_coffeaeformis.AAC.5